MFCWITLDRGGFTLSIGRKIEFEWKYKHVTIRCKVYHLLVADTVVPGGGFSHWHGIRICACLLGHLFAKFGIAIVGFSSETREPKLHKLGVFWANYCKKHPIWSKLGAFLSKMVYWWVGNLAKNWYRDSQIFEVRKAHPRTIVVKEPPPGRCLSLLLPALFLLHVKCPIRIFYLISNTILFLSVLNPYPIILIVSWYTFIGTLNLY